MALIQYFTYIIRGNIFDPPRNADAEKESLLRTPTEEANSCANDEDASLSQAATRGESEEGKDSQDAIEADSSEGGNPGRGIMMVNAMVSGTCRFTRW